MKRRINEENEKKHNQNSHVFMKHFHFGFTCPCDGVSANGASVRVWECTLVLVATHTCDGVDAYECVACRASKRGGLPDFASHWLTTVDICTSLSNGHLVAALAPSLDSVKFILILVFFPCEALQTIFFCFLCVFDIRMQYLNRNFYFCRWWIWCENIFYAAFFIKSDLLFVFCLIEEEKRDERKKGDKSNRCERCTLFTNCIRLHVSVRCACISLCSFVRLCVCVWSNLLRIEKETRINFFLFVLD